MEEFGIVYKRWVKYLIKKKLYGGWMRDLSLLANMESRDEYNWHYFSSKSGYSYEVLNTNYRHSVLLGVMYVDSNENLRIYLKMIMDRKPFYGCCTFVNYMHVYHEFVESSKDKNILSRSLSRKLKRATCKDTTKSDWNFEERQKQPWYDKSYEKYCRKAWRK